MTFAADFSNLDDFRSGSYYQVSTVFLILVQCILFLMTLFSRFLNIVWKLSFCNFRWSL